MPAPTDEFVAVDFETANAKRSSVCQVGLSLVRGGRVTASTGWLVRPPGEHIEFTEGTIKVHGIQPHMVVGAATWERSLARMVQMVAGRPLVAHNAAFDMSVIVSASEAAGVEHPAWNYLCTFKVAKRLLPDLENHRLPTVGAEFGVGEFDHHDAAADARVCGQAASGLMARADVTDLAGLAEAAGHQLAVVGRR